jgi:hypothetical protein
VSSQGLEPIERIVGEAVVAARLCALFDQAKEFYPCVAAQAVESREVDREPGAGKMVRFEGGIAIRVGERDRTSAVNAGEAGGFGKQRACEVETAIGRHVLENEKGRGRAAKIGLCGQCVLACVAQLRAVAQTLAAKTGSLKDGFSAVANVHEVRAFAERASAEVHGPVKIDKLDRLSRSVRDFAEIFGRVQRNGWALVVMDLGVDTSTIMGAAMAQMVSVFSELERKRIAERTREALAVKKASGVRLGRPPTVPQSVVRRIQRQRARGDSLRAIADSLNRDMVPTAQGGLKWYAATVRGILARSS